jgi:large subunit ribosomal protein L32e
MTAKFLRRTWSRYSKLGKRRKNKQVWRKPTGRDNKMREKRRGYPAIVSIGHRTDKKSRGKVKEKIPKTVRNLLDLKNLEKNDIIILGRIGNTKK